MLPYSGVTSLVMATLHLILAKRPRSNHGHFRSEGFLKGFLRPGWLSGKESASQCRRYRFDPSFEKVAHAAKQLRRCATTIEPVL